MYTSASCCWLRLASSFPLPAAWTVGAVERTDHVLRLDRAASGTRSTGPAPDSPGLRCGNRALDATVARVRHGNGESAGLAVGTQLGRGASPHRHHLRRPFGPCASTVAAQKQCDPARGDSRPLRQHAPGCVQKVTITGSNTRSRARRAAEEPSGSRWSLPSAPGTQVRQARECFSTRCCSPPWGPDWRQSRWTRG